MSRFFEELDYQPTAIGPISLRRRRELRLDVDVLEILLGDEHLMSDLFTTSEVALAEYGLGAIADNRPLSVVVGGLGMGFTADAALNDPRIESLIIVEKLAPVIGWHESGLIPLGKRLGGDPKCRFVEGDFFQMVAGKNGFDPAEPARKFDAILLDIDHAPDFHLNYSHAKFYGKEGMENIKYNLNDNGLFSLWSNNAPDNNFVVFLKETFDNARAEKVTFYNSILEEDCTQTVYIAKK